MSREEEGILQGDAGSLGEDGVELGREGDTRPVAAAVEANRQGMDEVDRWNGENAAELAAELEI